MRICFDNDGNSPGIYNKNDYDSFSISPRTLLGTISDRIDVIAEKRPDGKWYMKRDWDAVGYTDFYIGKGSD